MALPLRSVLRHDSILGYAGARHIGRMERVLRPWALLRVGDPLPGKVAVGGAKTRRETGTKGDQKSPIDTHWEVGQYHEACDNIGTVTRQPPAETMNVCEADPTPANLAIAQQQADSLRGNALKSLREMSGAVTHTVWYFGQNRRDVGPRTAASRERAQQRAAKFRFRGHLRANSR